MKLHFPRKSFLYETPKVEMLYRARHYVSIYKVLKSFDVEFRVKCIGVH